MFFLKGIIIGFSIAAPVGPIGVLCIRRTLEKGKLSGFVSGLGAATADALYGLIAALGLTVIMNFLIGQQMWFQLIGGVFLCYLGIKTFIKKPTTVSANARGGELFASYISTFLLTLTNPVTILSFIAIFSGLGMTATHQGMLSSTLLVIGLFLGSTLWWLILSSMASLIKKERLNIINWISGLILVIFGIRSLYTLL